MDLRVRLDDQGGCFLICPLSHGSIVVLGIFVAEKTEDEHTVRRTDPALSIREYLLVWCDSIVVQNVANLVRWLKSVGLSVH